MTGTSGGYKQPPKHSQFKPGQSGNPSGRPKGARSFKSDLAEELSVLIQIREGDNEITVTKQRALVKRLLEAGMKGDQRAISTIIFLSGQGDETGAADKEAEAKEDSAIVRAVSRRVGGRSSTADELTKSHPKPPES